MTRTLPRRPLLISMLLLCAAVQAADPPKKAPSVGDGKGTGALLTRDQLRDCLMREEGLKSRHAQATQLQTSLGAEQTELDRLAAALKEQAGSVDLKNAEAVAAYNAQVQSRQKLADDYNARAAQFNAQSQALQDEGEAFRKACDNRRFDDKDAAALRSGK